MSREFPCRLHRIVTGDRIIADFDLGFDVAVRKLVALTGVKTPVSRGDNRSVGLQATEYVASWFEENDSHEDWPFLAYTSRHDTNDIWRAEIYALGDALSLNERLIEYGWGNNE